MIKQLEKEAAEDEEVYDKMACWCETNDKAKTKAIAEAEARISDLTSKIEELTGNSARLGTEIKNLEKEVAENQAALDQATAIRQKQLAEFNAEEKDLLESISALKAAVTVLSKHHGGSLVQIPRSHMLSVAATLQHEMQKHASILAGQAQIDTKTQELADTDEKLAMAKQDIEDTRNTLAADEQFLMMLKEKCSMTDKEWDEQFLMMLKEKCA